MGLTSNPSTDLKTYPTTAEPGPFTPWLSLTAFLPEIGCKSRKETLMKHRALLRQVGDNRKSIDTF